MVILEPCMYWEIGNRLLKLFDIAYSRYSPDDNKWISHILIVRLCVQAAQPSELGAKAAVGQVAVETVAG